MRLKGRSRDGAADMSALRRVVDWLEHRAGLRSAARHVLDERLPAGTGWWHTLGSALLVLLGVQVATGVALALYTCRRPTTRGTACASSWTGSPSPRRAQPPFLRRELIVVAAGAHLLRSFVFGAYKAPRELT